jgi:hypothetical protein
LLQGQTNCSKGKGNCANPRFQLLGERRKEEEKKKKRRRKKRR